MFFCIFASFKTIKPQKRIEKNDKNGFMGCCSVTRPPKRNMLVVFGCVGIKSVLLCLVFTDIIGLQASYELY